MPIPIDLVFVLALVVIVFWMNIKATLLVVRDSLSDARQRLLQLLMVWLLPILGAVIVFSVHRPTEKHSGNYREPADAGGDFEFPRHNRRERSNAGLGDD